MTVKSPASAPPNPIDAEDGWDGPPDLEVTLVGYAAQKADEGARAAKMTRGDFVIESTIAGAAMARWEALGFSIYARDRYGREYELSPAVLGIKPPPSLEQ